MKIYCDGSARPTNPGPGGLAIVVCNDNDNIITSYFKSFKWTTNNIMELTAIMIAVLLYGNKGLNLTIYSDSAYAINCFTTWMYSWERNGWVKSDGNIPENLGIIREYHKLMSLGYRAELVKVKGHSTCRGNQLADEIASGKRKADIEL